MNPELGWGNGSEQGPLEVGILPLIHLYDQ